MRRDVGDRHPSGSGADARGRAGAEGTPQGFTLPLALADAVPVALFCLSALVVASRVASPLFVVGAAVSAVGALGKVLWKLLVALADKDMRPLYRQMAMTMPTGFVLMAAGLLTARVSWAPVLAAALSLPALPLLAAWVACMALMGWLGSHRNQMDARSNWVEQLTNSGGQACLLAALLLLP